MCKEKCNAEAKPVCPWLGEQQVQKELGLWSCEGWREKEVEYNIPIKA